MSTTGDLTVVDKTHPQTIPVGTTQVPVVIDGATSFEVAEGPTFFEFQVDATFSKTVASRPTRVIFELCRYKPDGTTDPTHKTVRSIVQPGTTSYSDVITAQEFVSPSDGRYGWTISHNGAASIKLTLKGMRAHNPAAYIAARTSPDPND